MLTGRHFFKKSPRRGLYRRYMPWFDHAANLSSNKKTGNGFWRFTVRISVRDMAGIDKYGIDTLWSLIYQPAGLAWNFCM